MNEPIFPISYWVGPPLTADRIQEAAGCGFTVLPIVAATEAELRRGLDLVQQAGVQALVVDRRIHRDLPDRAGWETVVNAVVEAYADHPALYGYMLTDEPHLRDFEKLAALTAAFRQRDPERVPYINLFPNYASAEQLGALSYEAHVAAYLDTVRPPVLSYDHYALMEWGDRPEYFENLEIIRRQALRAGVPFWNIILATPHFSYRDPSPADLRWQVITTLAYGGKGLAYFTYWTLDVENYRDGIISMYGERTPKYAVVQQLNRELHRLGPHLLKLTSTRVAHWPDAPQGATVLDGEGLVTSVEGGAFVVGEFVGEAGDGWVMVVNRDREHAAWTTLRLAAPGATLDEVARSTGELRPISRDQGVDAVQTTTDGLVARFWLAPADGRLLRVRRG
ncbi:MAG: hypothetical protein JXC32_20585 [Anaerolineae bacterium]|nr:hypothetical protein [Anaerolineae bacterium]